MHHTHKQTNNHAQGTCTTGKASTTLCSMFHPGSQKKGGVGHVQGTIRRRRGGEELILLEERKAEPLLFCTATCLRAFGLPSLGICDVCWCTWDNKAQNH